MQRWRRFFDARDFVRSLNLKNEKEWRIYRKQYLPHDIPTNPNRAYPYEWKGMGDWLGTFRIADQSREYLSFKNAKEWAMSSGIKNLKEWRIAIKENRIPDNIPKTPYNTYKNDWISWGDFLGTGFIHFKNRNWRSFENAQKWAVENNIYTKEDWENASKKKVIPPDIPALPHRVYSKWIGWPYFFGRELKGGSSVIEHIIRNELNKFVEIENNQRIVLNKRVDIIIKNQKIIIEYDGYHWHKNSIIRDKETNDIFTKKEWRIIRIREKPLKKISNKDLILDPKISTVNKVSLVLNHLLKINVVPSFKKLDLDKYLQNNELFIEGDAISKILGWKSFNESKLWAQNNHINSESEWRKCKRNNLLPIDIPCNPNIVYLQWKSWSDFLGTENIYIQPNLWREFVSSRNWSRNSGIKSAREWGKMYDNNDIPKDIPRTPDKVYKLSWISWMDWLGIDCKKGHRKAWVTFEEAKVWIKENKIRSERVWRIKCKENKIPNNIPKSPAFVYKDKWKGWTDFFNK